MALEISAYLCPLLSLLAFTSFSELYSLKIVVSEIYNLLQVTNLFCCFSMATHVVLSPKHTIMDQSLKDPAAGNNSKKVKRILDFFSSTSRTSAPGCVLKEVGVTEHAEEVFGPLDVRCQKESGCSFENDQGGTAGRELQNGVTCVIDDSEKSLDTLTRVLQIESEPNVSSPSESCRLEKSTAVEKKQLATNKKAKGQIGNGVFGAGKEEKKQLATNEKATTQKGNDDFGAEKEHRRRLTTNKKVKGKIGGNKARVEEEQKDDPESNMVKNVPQEMDYEEFMKTFAQTECQNRDITKTGTKKSEQSTNLTCTAVNLNRNNCTEEKATKTELNVNRQQTKDYPSTSPILEVEGHEQQSGLTKSKTDKTCNAFSLLMQARSNPQKEMSAENGSQCVKAKDAQNNQENVVSITDDEDKDTDQPDEVPLEKASCSSCSTPSVLNFFSKCAKGTKIEKDCGKPVLVKVDIHCDPAKQQITSHRGKSNNIQKVKVEKLVTTDNDSEIVFLGSETIEVDEFEEKYPNLRRKSKGSSSACIDLSQETSDPVVKITSKESEQTVDVAKMKNFFQDFTSPTDKLVRKAQATLQFARSGHLAMNTSVIVKPAKKSVKKDKDKVDSPETANNIMCKKSRIRTRSKRQRTSSAYDSDQKALKLDSVEMEKENSTNEIKSAVKPKQKKTLTRLR